MGIEVERVLASGVGVLVSVVPMTNPEDRPISTRQLFGVWITLLDDVQQKPSCVVDVCGSASLVVARPVRRPLAMGKAGRP